MDNAISPITRGDIPGDPIPDSTRPPYPYYPEKDAVKVWRGDHALPLCSIVYVDVLALDDVAPAIRDERRASYARLLQCAPERAYTHYCGYVRLGGPVADEKLDWLTVHGGITYEKRDADGTAVYGFDCAHVGDERDDAYYDVEGWLTQHVMELATQLQMVAEIDEHDVFWAAWALREVSHP
jgi:hypothetical protein